MKRAILHLPLLDFHKIAGLKIFLKILQVFSSIWRIISEGQKAGYQQISYQKTCRR
jgi:hypothetical protein